MSRENEAKAAQGAYDLKIELAEKARRPDAAQALRDVEDAIRAANNLHVIYGADIVGTAQLILEESRHWRHENGIRRGRDG